MKELLVAAIVLAAATLTGCSPPVQRGLSEGWRIGQLISQGEKVESITEFRTVGHCGPILEQKTVSCTAGTLNEMAVMSQAGTGLSLGLEVTLDAGISSALGINRESGESLELVSPPNGTIYNYAVTTQYRIVSGEALATDLNGVEQTMTYLFQASCTLQIEAVEETPCLLVDVQATPVPGEPTSQAEATRRQAETAMDLLDEANLLYQQGDYELALTKYSQAIALDNTDPIAYNQRGNTFRKLMRFGKAVEDYGIAIDFAASQLERAVYLNNRAAAHRENRNFLLALSDVEQAIAANPNLAGAYENQALIYRAMNDDVNTILSLNIFLRLSPENFYALDQRGEAYARLDNFQAAVQDFSAAIILRPDDAYSYLKRALAQERAGNLQAAFSDLAQVLDINPGFGLARFERGRIYFDLGDYAAAVQDLDAAVEIGYASSDTYRLRGEANLALEFNQQALEDFNRAIKLDPRSHLSYRGRGLALFRLENYLEAIDNFNRALDLSENEADLYFYRGAARSELGVDREALEDLRLFLALDPQSELRTQAEALIGNIGQRLEDS